MLNIDYEPSFLRIIEKIKDNSTKDKVQKKILKIIANPEIGKPMRHGRKGTRELYIAQFRLSYVYIKDENKIIFLDFYHKDEQ
jgi:mRNA-degrading endonuclease RelE of RelBE toxin-antitoxin system